MASIRTILCAAAGLLLCAASAQASSLVIGGGAAKDCADAAIDGRSDNASLTTCTLALETEILSFRDQARTYVNRGDVKAAYLDYSKAAELDPDWDAPKTELARFTVKRP